MDGSAGGNAGGSALRITAGISCNITFMNDNKLELIAYSSLDSLGSYITIMLYCNEIFL